MPPRVKRARDALCLSASAMVSIPSFFNALKSCSVRLRESFYECDQVNFFEDVANAMEY